MFSRNKGLTKGQDKRGSSTEQRIPLGLGIEGNKLLRIPWLGSESRWEERQSGLVGAHPTTTKRSTEVFDCIVRVPQPAAASIRQSDLQHFVECCNACPILFGNYKTGRIGIECGDDGGIPKSMSTKYCH